MRDRTPACGRGRTTEGREIDISGPSNKGAALADAMRSIKSAETFEQGARDVSDSLMIYAGQI